jgi:hypothetical protein
MSPLLESKSDGTQAEQGNRLRGPPIGFVCLEVICMYQLAPDIFVVMPLGKVTNNTKQNGCYVPHLSHL